MKLRLSRKERSGSVRNGVKLPFDEVTVDIRERVKGDSDWGPRSPDGYGCSFELGRLHMKQGFAVRVGSKG